MSRIKTWLAVIIFVTFTWPDTLALVLPPLIFGSVLIQDEGNSGVSQIPKVILIEIKTESYAVDKNLGTLSLAKF